MLSARQLKMPNGLPPQQSAPTPSGFGKVLSSVKGLQQRLDDFSAEEVTRAHTQAIELIQQLSNLHGHLESLKTLRRLFMNAGTEIAALPDFDLSLIDPKNNALEKHPRLWAIVKAGELLEKHRSLRASQQPDASDMQRPASNAAESGAVSTTTPSPSGARQALVSPESIIRTVKTTDRIESANASGTTEGVPGATEFSLVGQPQERQAHFDGYDFAALKLDDGPRMETASASRKSNEPPSDIAQSGASAFDHRLLRDLIDSYGEFAAINENTPGRCLTADTAPLSQPSQPPAANPVAGAAQHHPETAAAAVARESEAISADALVPREPNFVEVKNQELLALPAPQKDGTERDFDPLTSNPKSREEIDQQLKSIIRDYGKVDLYSHPKSANAKTKIIAGATLLALVLGGLYFFSPSSDGQAPKEVSPMSEAVSPAGSDAKNSVRQK